MAERPKLDATMVKGQAKPLERGAAWQKKHPITVRLTSEQYEMLQKISTSRIPRLTHQEIMVAALEQYHASQPT